MEAGEKIAFLRCGGGKERARASAGRGQGRASSGKRGGKSIEKFVSKGNGDRRKEKGDVQARLVGADGERDICTGVTRAKKVRGEGEKSSSFRGRVKEEASLHHVERRRKPRKKGVAPASQEDKAALRRGREATGRKKYIRPEASGERRHPTIICKKEGKGGKSGRGG